MKKLTDTLVGISVNKDNAEKKFQTRDTVFKRGSVLNSFTNSYSSERKQVGYKSNRNKANSSQRK